MQSHPRIDAFVGRDHEFSRLTHLLGEADRANSGIVALVGEAGIGKTRLAREFAVNAAAAGAEVLWGRCYDPEATAPFGPLAAMLRSHFRDLDEEHIREEAGDYLDQLARVERSLLRFCGAGTETNDAGIGDQRVRLFEAVSGFLRHISRERTAVLVYDDLQWADIATHQFLRYLTDETAIGRVLILCTYRSHETGAGFLGETIAVLSKSMFFTRMHLGSLSRTETASYLEQATDSKVNPAFAAAFHHRTEGHPLHMVELARDIEDFGVREAWSSRIPEGVQEAVARRLARLTAAEQRVLSMASVLGAAFELPVLVHLLEESEEKVLESLERAIETGLIEEIEDQTESFRFSHKLFQEALANNFSETRRSWLHLRIAEILEEIYGNESSLRTHQIVRHLALAGKRAPTDKLCRLSLLAAENAITDYAPEEAELFIDRALASGGDIGDPMRAALYHCRGRAVGEMGIGESVEDLKRAFDIYERLGDVDNAVQVALTPVQVILRMGSFTTGVEVNTGDLELCRRALAMVQDGSAEEGALLCQWQDYGNVIRALEIARNLGDPKLEMEAQSKLAVRLNSSGDFDGSEEAHGRAIELAKRLGDTVALHYCYYWKRYTSIITGRTKEAERCIEEMFNLAELKRSRRFLLWALHAAAEFEYLRGNWEACRKHAERNLSLQRGSGGFYSHQVSVIAMMMVDYETGNHESADRLLVKLGRMSHSEDIPGPLAAAKVSRLKNDLSRLDELARALNAILNQSANPFSWVQSSIRMSLALVAILLQDTKEAAKYAGLFLHQKHTYNPGDPCGKSVDAALGLLCSVLDRLDESKRHFEDAIAFCRSAGYLPELAWTLVDYADTLFRLGDQDDKSKGTLLLVEANETARSLGMSLLLERIEAKMKGGDKPPNPAGLTRRELEVIREIAQGLTNQEIAHKLFISPQTVASHVQNILSKTGSANRAEASTYALREGLIT